MLLVKKIVVFNISQITYPDYHLYEMLDQHQTFQLLFWTAWTTWRYVH